MTSVPAGLRLSRRQRLAHAKQFVAVYEAKAKKVMGPLIVFARPNGLPFARLGLSVAKAATRTNVRRNRSKRLLREAFRHVQHNLPGVGTPSGSYDLVIGVRAHEELALGDYQRHLLDAARALHALFLRRADGRRSGDRA